MLDAPPATIVVTAPALPAPEAERAFGVELLDAARLRNAGSTQLDQLLKAVPGLQLFRRSDARSGHPTSQGVTLRALGGNASSRALLILDGVPQSDPFGGWVNWPAYDPASLAEVRIVRGGGSVVHGPGALAGTIEMVSNVATALDAGVEAGSRAAFEARAMSGVALGGGVLSLSGRAARGDGFIPITASSRGPADRRAPFAAASGRAHFAAPLAPDIALDASLFAFRDKRERGLAFTTNRTDGADASLRLIGSGAWAWSALGYAQWRKLRSSFASVDPDRSVATRVLLQDAVPSTGIGGSAELRPPVGHRIELRLGIDARRTSGTPHELYLYSAGQPTRRRRSGGETLTAGAFAEAAVNLGAVTLSGGARLDRWRITDGALIERNLASGAVLRDERYPARAGWRPTARGGVAAALGGGFSLRSAAYLGWRLPTLNELFRPFRAGSDATAANPLLDPERLTGIEAGAAFARDGLALSLTAFGNRLSHAIANVTLGRGPGIFPGVGFVSGEYRQRQNLDAIDVSGVEASAELRRGAWTARAGYSLADARVDASGGAAALDGLRPAQTPRHVLSAGLDWSQDGRTLSLSLRRSGAQYEDDLNALRLPPATTLDAFAAWPLSPRVQLFARAENLLDARVVAGIGGDGAVERATPRSLSLGLRIGNPTRPSRVEP
ncbi:MAG: TonB-dependent receptor [Sphingomicrobium sp.]